MNQKKRFIYHHSEDTIVRYGKITNLLETIHELPNNEKVKVMEFLWDDITVEEKSYSSPKWHKDVLRDTEERVSEGKEKFIDWSQAILSKVILVIIHFLVI